MKYTILINQAHVFNAGLHTQTDLVDWAILDYINGWQGNPKASKLQDYVWINYQYLINEMPLLGLNSKSAVSNRIAKLKSLNLLEAISDDFGRVFLKTSQFFFSITQFSENAPALKASKPKAEKTPVHQNEQSVHQNEHPVHQNAHSYTHQTLSLNPLTNNNGLQTSSSELSPVVVVELEKTFSSAELPAAKKITASLPAQVQLEVLAVLVAALKGKAIKSKISYLSGIVSRVNDGTFTALPVEVKPLSSAERIEKEKIKQAESEKRAKVDNVRYFADLYKKCGSIAAIPAQYLQAVSEQLANQGIVLNGC